MEMSGMEHEIVLSERKRLSVTGVEEVESFDENTVVMVTRMGNLVVRGEQLHIEALSLEGGELRVEGEIEALSYEAPARREGGLLSRLFG